jgi:hypothetical protein
VTTTHPLRRSRWISPVVAAGLILAACGDDSDDSSDSDFGDAPTTTEAEAGPEEAPDAEGEDAGAAGVGLDGVEYTPPGTQLSFGEEAIVPIEYAGDEAAFSVTFTGFDEGTQAELEASGFDVSDLDASLVPFYGRGTFELVAAEDGFGRATDFDDFRPVLANGSPAGITAAFGQVDGCDASSADRPEDLTGPFERCRFWLEDPANPPTQIEFQGKSSSPYSDDPIVWSE